jgi:hypothetical protein
MQKARQQCMPGFCFGPPERSVSRAFDNAPRQTFFPNFSDLEEIVVKN